MSHLTTPKLPRKDFPLRIHRGVGQWCKKIKGKVHYFGSCKSDPKGVAAEAEWNRVSAELYNGRARPVKATADGVTVRDLVNRYLNSKLAEVREDNLSPHTFGQLHSTCSKLVDFLGERHLSELSHDDFRLLKDKLYKKAVAPNTRRNLIARVRSVFVFGYNERMMDIPVDRLVGEGFKRPRTKAVDRARMEHEMKNGLAMFTPGEIQTLLDAANPQMKAAILLALNCGLGASDIAALPLASMTNHDGWLCFPRVKTLVPRRCKLWRETIAALEEYLAQRPTPNAQARGLAFVQENGQPWVWTTDKHAIRDELGRTFGKLLRKLGIHRPKLGLYAMRHTFATFAQKAADRDATSVVMGHKIPGMIGKYVHSFPSERLEAVCNTVHDQVFEVAQ